MEWIPMSKGTPKVSGCEYLVTVEDIDGDRWVETDSWTGEGWWACDVEAYSKVIAWAHIPEPEPYQGEV